ncbi:initiation factor 2 [Sistotremastrum niveocremeum HHB9708]|uniref:Translation initiation factor IF-2, mitochondrial n=1 Tax=Sistotremastrum niveocremeum HHB9708 TaxID=1314777 RepID=A0A165AJZ1_9AGAM|nr:initiation factor 2 [Sistotremastrum niveocremeum HHB9708]
MKQAGMGELSYDHILRSDDASLLAMELGFDPIVDDEAAFDLHPLPPHPDVANLPERPPVVTIMGHVDHGKTTLLDTLRSSSVAKGESGGITQHIGAFSVNVPGTSQSGARTITFLDTPGHAAFSAMRARGARMTDIVVLVVAADDGVMPQTKEVINLIKKDEGNIGVVVAINKVDKPGVDVEKIEKALLAEGLELETFGGEVPVVHVSGLTGQGLDLLIENISALAELQELRSDVEGQAQGYIVESRMQKGLGPVATVLLLRGSLKPQSHIISGFVHAKVRQMTDANGKVVKLAQPGMAVTVAGWKSLPAAGDEVLEGEEHDIKRAIINRVRRADLAAVVEDAEAINVQRQLDREKRQKELLKVSTKTRTSSRSVAEDRPTEDLQKELRLVIKCDVSGSVEAVVGALEGIGNKHAKVKIVSSGVGDVTESDAALIVAFSVSTPRAVEAIASASDIQIIESPIIYRLMEDVTSEVIKLLPPIIEQRVTGEASVLQIFEIQLKGKQTMKVAGCRVTNGSLEKSRKARVVRAGNAIFEGNIETFRHLKKDVLEAKRGTECGISLQSFNDLRADDAIQCIEILEKPGKL